MLHNFSLFDNHNINENKKNQEKNPENENNKETEEKEKIKNEKDSDKEDKLDKIEEEMKIEKEKIEEITNRQFVKENDLQFEVRNENLDLIEKIGKLKTN